MKRSRNSIGLWLVMAICLVVLFWVSGYGHGDEKHDETNGKNETIDIGQALTNNSILRVKMVIDSINSDIGSTYKTVESIFEKSCYDCHSDKINYPWYYKIPTIDAMIDSDIKEARGHLDLSKGFPFEGHADQLSQLRAIREEVEENEMPLWSYRMIHWGTTIEGTTQDSLFKWIDESIEKLETVYKGLGIPLQSEEETDDDE